MLQRARYRSTRIFTREPRGTEREESFSRSATSNKGQQWENRRMVKSNFCMLKKVFDQHTGKRERGINELASSRQKKNWHTNCLEYFHVTRSYWTGRCWTEYQHENGALRGESGHVWSIHCWISSEQKKKTFYGAEFASTTRRVRESRIESAIAKGHCCWWLMVFLLICENWCGCRSAESFVFFALLGELVCAKLQNEIRMTFGWAERETKGFLESYENQSSTGHFTFWRSSWSPNFLWVEFVGKAAFGSLSI